MRVLVAAFLAGALLSPIVAAEDFNIRTIPPGLTEEIEKNPAAMTIIGAAEWALLCDLSRQVKETGLTGISERKYMPLSRQREMFGRVRNCKDIAADVRLILQDLIIQYYFFTYYYHTQIPAKQEFTGEHTDFLQSLGVEYVWVEAAAQNYYQHTLLKQLITGYPNSKWGKFYQQIYMQNGFAEIPRESEAEAAGEVSGSERRRSTAHFQGQVEEGRPFERYFGPGFHFLLEPRPLGWEIVVRFLNGKDNIARLTPPFHSVPNPREIEGWHFRNSDNSGANEPGEKNVNAPGEEREFIFSPEPIRTLKDIDSSKSVSEEDIQRVSAFGHGSLKIVEYRLADLNVGQQAKFEFMRFEVDLSWPSGFTPTEEK